MENEIYSFNSAYSWYLTILRSYYCLYAFPHKITRLIHLSHLFKLHGPSPTNCVETTATQKKKKKKKEEV